MIENDVVNSVDVSDGVIWVVAFDTFCDIVDIVGSDGDIAVIWAEELDSVCINTGGTDLLLFVVVADVVISSLGEATKKKRTRSDSVL